MTLLITYILFHYMYRIIHYRRAVHECEGLGVCLLVLKHGPNHYLLLWVKSMWHHCELCEECGVLLGNDSGNLSLITYVFHN